MTAALAVVPVSDLERLISEAVAKALALRPANEAPAEWLDTKGVAALIGVHPRSVAQYVKSRGPPCKRLGPKTVRYNRADVLAGIADRKR